MKTFQFPIIFNIELNNMLLKEILYKMLNLIILPNYSSIFQKKKEEADQMRVFEIPIKEKVMTISTNFIKNQNKNKLYIIHIFTVSF